MPLGLEAEGQVDPREVVVEVGVEELLLDRRAAQLERLVEASLDEPETQTEVGAVAGVVALQAMRSAEVLEGGARLVRTQPLLALLEVLVSAESRVHASPARKAMVTGLTLWLDGNARGGPVRPHRQAPR